MNTVNLRERVALATRELKQKHPDMQYAVISDKIHQVVFPSWSSDRSKRMLEGVIFLKDGSISPTEIAPYNPDTMGGWKYSIVIPEPPPPPRPTDGVYAYDAEVGF